MSAHPDIQNQRFTAHLPLPPRGCSPNARVHWAVRSKAVRQARRSAFAVFLNAKPGWWAPVPVVLMVAYRMRPGGGKRLGYRPHDVQNAIAALKASIDGMVDAGIVPNDSARWVSWGEVQIQSVVPGDRLGEGVFVTVATQAAAREQGSSEAVEGERDGQAEPLGKRVGDHARDEPAEDRDQRDGRLGCA